MRNSVFRTFVAFLLLLAFQITTEATVSSSQLEGWQNKAGDWGATIQSTKASYSEGKVIPLRFVATYPACTVHTVRIKYDFANGSKGHFFDYLQSFDATESGVLPLKGFSLPANQQAAAVWSLPRDLSLTPGNPSFVQPTGQITTYNVSQLNINSSYTLANGVKEIVATFTVAGSAGSGNRTVIIAYGGHLASEIDWGSGGGASQFPGASRKALLSPDGGSSLNVSINPDSLVPKADLVLTEIGPSFACVGSSITYQLTVGNLGPNTANSVVLTSVLPAHATFLTGSTTAGVLTGTGPVNLCLPSLAPGASVGVSLTVRLNGAGSGSVLSTASVTSHTSDPVSGNNLASVATSTVDRVAPVFVSSPTHLEVNNDSGVCGAVVQYSASATDNCVGSVALEFTPPSGSTLPVGVTMVTVTARDAAGNSAQRQFSVTVRDTELPTISSPPAITVASDNGACAATLVELGLPVVGDNCPSWTVQNNAPASFPLGSTTVTWTVTDASHNQASGQQLVTVVDHEAPVIAVPADYVLDLGDGQCDLVIDYSAAPATAIDNCTGPVTLLYAPPAGTVLGPGDHPVTVTSSDSAGNSATSSFTVRVRDNPNVSWPAARPLALSESTPGLFQTSFSQCLNSFDQSRWYRFNVKPGDRVIALLTGLPQNYDLVLFKDIQQAYEELVSQAEDLPLLNAQFAADAFSPAAFSADAFSPAAFSPAAFSPAAFSPAAFSPAAFSPAAFSPAAFSPAAFSPDAYAPAAFSPTAFSPAAFSPAAFSPAAFSPAAFSPAAFSPAAFSPAAFSDAQVRSVIAVSAFAATANEGLIADTWNSTGDFYVRVRGRNGAFEPGAPFQLTVYVLPGTCESVQASPPAEIGSGPAAESGNYHTLILTDLARTQEDVPHSALANKLAELAARPEVKGRVIDLGAYPRVKWFNDQADANSECPFAKNLLAASIRDVIGQWRALNPVENIVLVGDDGVIPFFRYPDQALLGPEKNYLPPVQEFTSSQAALRLNYVLGQDAYGASCELQLKVATLPLLEVPVGRLVESASEIIGLVQAYLDTPTGVVPTPTSALVTGYDFLSDAATAVQSELEAGMGVSVDTLIDPATVAPANGWTADLLRNSLFGRRHDVVYLAGHFSAFSALAADYQTFILASELDETATDFKNTILFSAGCHSGYNAVDPESIPFVTPQPDWAQAAARRQATLIAGTGYQYGDTDFIEYSERLYLRFSRELRMGSGPVSVGQALLRAKRYYLATTPVMRGIHEKAFLESTLFGLPMLKVNMPAGRLPAESDGSDVGALSPAESNPGQVLGLARADLTVIPTFKERSLVLQNIEGGGTVTASYLEGSKGTLVNPAEPILPLEVRNATVPGTTLRGVGWRGGTYADQPGVIPLTGAATTEIRGVHATFLTDVLFPVRFWSVNYFDAVCGTQADATRLYIWPSQFLSDNGVEPQGTRRQHTRLDFRLFYSDNTQAYLLDDGSGSIVPAVSSPPSISGVFTSTDANKVKFQAYVTGNPAAGIEEVWVTYTAVQGPLFGKWISLNLTQEPTETTLWRGELDLTGLGIQADDLRYVVQAVNGVGLVSLNTRLGAFHIPGENDGWETVNAIPTSVDLIDPPTEANFGAKVTFTASWSSSGGASLAGRSVVFNLGDQQVVSRTDDTGHATATLNVLSIPGNYELKITFPGGFGFAPSFEAVPFTIKPAASRLELDPAGASIPVGGSTGVSALLSDQNGPLIERSVLFVLTGPTTIVRAAITDLTGRARLGSFPSGSYSLTAYFGEKVTLPDGVTVVDLRDVRYLGSHASAQVIVDTDPPTLASLTVDKPVLRPPNHKMVSVKVLAKFSDASGPTVSRIIQITSNEPENDTGDGNTGPDFVITGPLTADLRAERSGNGKGRIYTILVETTDPIGNKRRDVVLVTVPK